MYLLYGLAVNGTRKYAVSYLKKSVLYIRSSQGRSDRTLPQGMKGLEAPAIKNKIALRVSLTGSIFMDSVKVSHDQLLPKSLGLGSAFSCLNSARYVVYTSDVNSFGVQF